MYDSWDQDTQTSTAASIKVHHSSRELALVMSKHQGDMDRDGTVQRGTTKQGGFTRRAWASTTADKARGLIGANRLENTRQHVGGGCVPSLLGARDTAMPAL